jgi:hypothetical protein
MGYFWILWEFTFFNALMVEKRRPRIMLCEMFLWPLREIGFHVLQKQIHVLSPPCLVVFTPLNWHCVISQLCSHVSKRYHCRSHSSWLGLVDCFFLWACYNSCDSFEGWCLSCLVPNRHVFPFNYRGIQMFTLVGWQVFSLMCQHDVGNERHWKPSYFSFVCIV